MIQHVAFGIILDDIVFPDGVTRMSVLGGGGPQTAWGMAAALGSGDAVGLVAGVGEDLPPEALAPLRAAGINLDGVRQTEHPRPRLADHRVRRAAHAGLARPAADAGRATGAGLGRLAAPYRAARTFHWGIHPDDPGPSLAFATDLIADGRRVSLGRSSRRTAR